MIVKWPRMYENTLASLLPHALKLFLEEKFNISNISCEFFRKKVTNIFIPVDKDDGSHLTHILVPSN